MFPPNLFLSTAVLGFTLYNIYSSPALGAVTIRLSLAVFAAWAFATYGDDLVDTLGLSSGLSASKYTGPFVLVLGWVFLVIFALVISALCWRWFA